MDLVRIERGEREREREEGKRRELARPELSTGRE